MVVNMITSARKYLPLTQTASCRLQSVIALAIQFHIDSCDDHQRLSYIELPTMVSIHSDSSNTLRIFYDILNATTTHAKIRLTIGFERIFCLLKISTCTTKSHV